jgi:hypothetical protein
MKKELDIESMLTKLRIKKLDPAIEDACHNKLVYYFANLEAKEALKKKQLHYQIKFVVYSVALLFVFCIVSITKTKYDSLVVIAKAKTSSILESRYNLLTKPKIRVNLLTHKSSVTLFNKKILFDLKTEKIEGIEYPNLIELSDEEINLTKAILQNEKGRQFYFIAKQDLYNELFDGFCVGFLRMDEPVPDGNSGKDVKSKNVEKELNTIEILCSFLPTDPIIQIKGYQFPDSETKYAYVEVKPKEPNGFRTVIYVNLETKMVEQPDAIRIKTKQKKN